MNEQCFHCGEPISPADSNPPRYPVRWRQIEYNMCCAGCQAVAQTIIAAGLDDYYETREKPADRAAPLPDLLREQLQLFDTPELQASFVRIEPGNVRDAALILEGITCAACIWLNERHIGALPGVISVTINYTTHRARVRWDAERIALSSILESIAHIGYRAHPFDPGKSHDLHEAARKKALTRLWIAGLSMMQVMMYAVPIYLADPDTITREMEQLMQWASCALTLPVVLYSCVPFYQGAWRDLKRGHAGMDVPVVIGVLVAFLASVQANWRGHGAIYYDSVSMFVFLLLGGRYLETLARRRAGEAAESLVKLIPAIAHRFINWPSDRGIEVIPVAKLKVGDTILVKPGETFPADGLVCEGNGHADEALMTGESRPIPKAVDDHTVGGSLNIDSPIVMRVERIGEETRLASIVRLLDRAMAEKPRLAMLADQVAGWFVGVLLLTAAIAYLWWHIHDPDRALPVMVAILVISCPCALSLATPAALAAATGHLARSGLLITRGHALQALPDITDVVFDKTGTLTTGKLELQDIQAFGKPADEARKIAALLEACSEHPIAHALRSGMDEQNNAADDYINHPGAGVSAIIHGTRHFLGTLDLIRQNCAVPTILPSDWHPHSTRVYLATEHSLIAVFALGDHLKSEALQTIKALQDQNLRVHLLSGDGDGPVQEIAHTLGITSVTAQSTPAEKLDFVQSIQRSGRKVLMIGDGINDAPVLAAANVSIAVGSGTDTAQAAGDAVLAGSLLAIDKGIQIARKSKRIIRENLVWAVIYNVVALPVAMAGHVTPWLASLGMALSSLLVVCNALRLSPAHILQDKSAKAV